ncbi:MAG: hypothetical protein ACTHOI_05790 [Sphingomicrobium sp.]
MLRSIFLTAHPEEPVSLSNRRLEGRPFETGLRLRSVPPQDERM